MHNRAILALGLAGMAVSLQLWLQSTHEFDQGCWRWIAQGAPATDGCRDALLARAFTIFGLSAPAAGYWFYFTISVITCGRTVLPPRAVGAADVLSDVLVGAASVYTGCLVWFQAFIAEAWCPGCLLSALIVAGLLICQVGRKRTIGVVARGVGGGTASYESANRPCARQIV